MKWIAHRGVSAVAPENTLAAFRMAWAHDVDGVECDVQVSADGVVVVHHDETTGRCGDKDFVIAESDYAQLATVDVGAFKADRFAGERMPTLEAVLAAMPSGKSIQVEIKPEVVQLEAVIALLAQARSDIDLWVMSFNERLLQAVGERLPEVRLLWILDEQEARAQGVFARAQAMSFAGVDVNYRVVDASYVQQAKAHGLIVGTWTVNDAQLAQDFARWGVDMLASDYAPALLDNLGG